MNWTLYCGDALSVLKTLPEQSVQCCVTSPPYWGLRDYGHADQIGLESSPDAFVAALVAVFAEVRRVLRDDGVCWLNLGDSYASTSGIKTQQPQRDNNGGLVNNRIDSRGQQAWTAGSTLAIEKRFDCKPKDLMGVPWRVAFALQADGWYLRSDVIWSKPNPMPESVQDRPTKAHEYVFLLTKSERYWYNADAIREPITQAMLDQLEHDYEGTATKDYGAVGVQNPSSVKARIVANRRKTGGNFSRKYAEAQLGHGAMVLERPVYDKGANARTVWTVPTEASPYEHFAVMPKALARRCIVAGSPHGGVVLDPFAGVATTGVVALEEGRSFVGIELNPTYHALARERLANVAPLLATEVSA